MTTRARWLPKAKLTATTVDKSGAWKVIARDLYGYKEVASSSTTVEYSRTIAFTRTAAAGIEDRASYSRTIDFTRSVVLGVTLAASYERAISFSRTYTAGVASRAFYSAALGFGARVFELVISAILFWTTSKLSKKKASNYKNFFRGRR